MKNYEFAWPFCREPGSGRTLMTTAVWAVEWLGYRDIWTQRTKAGVKEAQGYFPIPLGLFMVECRADKRRARVPKMECGNFSLARGIHCCNNFLLIFFLPNQRLHVVKQMHIYIDIYIYIYKHTHKRTYLTA
jgi:hypothetical protein